jgi:anti-sigma regulatory factor (Ser/Thr protein kinase)
MRTEVNLPANRTAPMRARLALDDAIAPADLAERFVDARLAVSEIVVNALEHGRLEERDTIRLIVETDDDRVRVEVEQPTPAKHVDRIGPPPHDGRPGGFGLRLVDATVDAWGSDEGPPGIVWFELRR